MSLKSELRRELNRRNLSLPDLQKKANKQAKDEILAILVRSGLIDGKSKTQLGKDIRATGFKTSNNTFRNLYDKFHINPKKVNPAKQKKSTRPRVTEVPDLKGRGAGKYLYIAKLYTVDHSLKTSKRKFKKLPKKAINFSNLNYYNNQSEFGFWSDTLFTRAEIEKIFLQQFASSSNDNFISDITGSDYKGVLNTAYVDVIAFNYERVLKSD